MYLFVDRPVDNMEVIMMTGIVDKHPFTESGRWGGVPLTGWRVGPIPISPSATLHYTLKGHADTHRS